MCLAGAVVAGWSLKQEVAGWQGFEPFYCNDKYIVTEFNSVKTFRKNSIAATKGFWLKSVSSKKIKEDLSFRSMVIISRSSTCTI